MNCNSDVDCPDSYICKDGDCEPVYYHIAISWVLIRTFLSKKISEKEFRHLLEMQTSEDPEIRKMSNKLIENRYGRNNS